MPKPLTDADLENLRSRLEVLARELGFDQVGVAGTDLAADEANLERWLGRGPRTIDYVDEKLDLVVSPDGSVRWKDEDELQLAAELGPLDAGEVRAEAKRVLAAPPWPSGWEDWRPNPAWGAPALPDGWDVV